MTSNPASRARTAICSAPLECPSRPGLPTSSRSRSPSSTPVRATIARTSTSASDPAPTPTEPLTPVGARNSPNTSRSAPAHSPVVRPARAHSGVHALDRGLEVGGEWVGLGGLEPVDADDDVLAGLDPLAPTRVRGHELALHVAALDGRHRTTHRLD